MELFLDARNGMQTREMFYREMRRIRTFATASRHGCPKQETPADLGCLSCADVISRPKNTSLKASPKTGMSFPAPTSDTKTRTNNTMKLLLAKSNAGRIALHLLCLLRGGDCRFHCSGVSREFKSAYKKVMVIFSPLAFATAFNARRSKAQVEFINTKTADAAL